MVVDAQAVQSEIEQRLARHADAIRRSDVEAAVALYTPDAIVRPANLEPVRGHAAIRQFLTAWFLAMATRDGRYFTDELFVYNDQAFQLGTYELTAVPRGGESVRDRGSFTIVWQRQGDGSWRYHRGIFNSSLPVEPTISGKRQ